VGPDHLWVGFAHDNLAAVLSEQGDVATGRVQLERAQAIFQAAIGQTTLPPRLSPAGLTTCDLSRSDPADDELQASCLARAGYLLAPGHATAGPAEDAPHQTGA
jgi:hypothetical protein